MTDNPIEVGTPQRLAGPALVAAIVAVVLWGGFAVLLAANAGNANETEWARLAFVFASIEAVAFAAGGAIWGTSIQKERAEKAEASSARNATDASNGRALATALQADAVEGASSGDQILGKGGSDVAERHARLARSLFPDA
jgi:hypothetical protein